MVIIEKLIVSIYEEEITATGSKELNLDRGKHHKVYELKRKLNGNLVQSLFFFLFRN